MSAHPSGSRQDPTSSRPNLPLILLLWSVSVVFVTGWLPFLRGFLDGPSYQWHTSYFGQSFSGQGMSGDYWLPAVKTIFAITLLTLGWRGARPPFAALLIVWLVFGLADSLYSTLLDGESFHFHGDTLGIHVSIGWSAVAFYLASLVLACKWSPGDGA